METRKLPKIDSRNVWRQLMPHNIMALPRVETPSIMFNESRQEGHPWRFSFTNKNLFKETKKNGNCTLTITYPLTPCKVHSWRHLLVHFFLFFAELPRFGTSGNSKTWVSCCSEVVISSWRLIVGMWWGSGTVPKTNMDTQNDGLEKVTPFKYGHF